jgi:hypothetical protein
MAKTQAKLLLSHDPAFLSTVSLAPLHCYGIVADE